MTSSGNPFGSIHTWISQRAGGFLCNTIRSPGLTCSVCRTSAASWGGRCSPCDDHHIAAGVALADRVGLITYAKPGHQSGWVMRGYKRRPDPDPDHHDLVRILTLSYMAEHRDCAARLAGTPVTHWATVPSLPATPGQHPLHGIASLQSFLPEIPLFAAAVCPSPRSLNAAHFGTSVPAPPNAHVLLVEDTWTRGGHVQSAALALRRAGVAQISALVVARWLDPSWGATENFIRTYLRADFDPSVNDQVIPPGL